MNWDRIGTGRKPRYDNGITVRKTRERTRDFYTDFSENLHKESEKTGAALRKPTPCAGKYGKSVELAANSMDCARLPGLLKKVETRNLNYAQCDAIQVSVEEGCVYKAKADAEKNIVYLEVKTDDGGNYGYELEVSKFKDMEGGILARLVREACGNKQGQRKVGEDSSKDCSRD